MSEPGGRKDEFFDRLWGALDDIIYLLGVIAIEGLRAFHKEYFGTPSPLTSTVLTMGDLILITKLSTEFTNALKGLFEAIKRCFRN